MIPDPTDEIRAIKRNLSLKFDYDLHRIAEDARQSQRESERRSMAVPSPASASPIASEFVVCVNNDSAPASLIVWKVYRNLPDVEGQAHGMMRILDKDQSEPDGYLYPASMFAPIELPETAKQVLKSAGTQA